MSSFFLMGLSPLSFHLSAPCAGHTGQRGLSSLEHTAFPVGAETGAKAAVCVLLWGCCRTEALSCSRFYPSFCEGAQPTELCPAGARLLWAEQTSGCSSPCASLQGPLWVPLPPLTPIPLTSAGQTLLWG